MAVNQTSTVVGVFRDRTQADQAMDALNNAGFDRSQIHFAGPGTKGNFLEDIKSLFVGQSTSGSDIANNLTNMGFSNEEAQYYNNEYHNGNTIVTVQAQDREQEALNVLHSYNAYTYQDNPASADPANYAQQQSYADQSGYNTTNQEAPVQDQSQYQAGGQPSYADVPIQDQPTVITNPNYQPYANTDPDHPVAEPQPDGATDERNNVNYQQPYASTDTDRPAAEQQLDGATDERDNVSYQQPYTDTDRPAAEQQLDGATDERDNVNYQQLYTDTDRPALESQPDSAADERDNVSYQQPYATTDTDHPVAEPQSDGATNEHDTEFQNLQAQIQAIQQQLEDARAQLQSAKERETQVRAAREEREKRLNDSKQQLQDLQSELQNTLAELRDTQSRIGQYS